MKLIKSNKSIDLLSIQSEQQSRIIDINTLIAKKILVHPDKKNKANSNFLEKDNLDYYYGSPIFFPNEIIEKINQNGEINLKYHDSPLLQYYLIAQVKGKSEINAPPNSKAGEKHFYRMKTFCESVVGNIMLDIGCDNPKNSHLIYPNSFEYIGIDPSFSNKEFKIIGMAESLPFVDLSFDFVSFNTSLDHILDFNTALDESFRVLNQNGTIVIATYAWIEKATLLTDNVHFHHFREEQLLSAVKRNFKIIDLKRYEDPKNENHRYGLYIMAKKVYK